jgi:hypothetical protein
MLSVYLVIYKVIDGTRALVAAVTANCRFAITCIFPSSSHCEAENMHCSFVSIEIKEHTLAHSYEALRDNIYIYMQLKPTVSTFYGCHIIGRAVKLKICIVPFDVGTIRGDGPRSQLASTSGDVFGP